MNYENLVFKNFPENFLEKGKVLSVKSLDVQNITKKIIIKIKNIDLNCFISGYSVQEGKNYIFKLFLFDWSTEKTDVVEKKFFFKDVKKSPNHCILNGVIVEKFDEDGKNFVLVDCGFFVAVQMKDKLKIGDMVKAEGRLDAHLVAEISSS